MNSYSTPWRHTTTSGGERLAGLQRGMLCPASHCPSSYPGTSPAQRAAWAVAAWTTGGGEAEGGEAGGGEAEGGEAARDSQAARPPTSPSELDRSDRLDRESTDSGPLDAGLARSRVEALLLIAKSPLSYRRIAALAGLEDATQARTLVNQLNALYDTQGRGFRIEQLAGGSRMMTRSVVAAWLRRLGVLAPAIRLSWPMMETLAVVAYRQDVTRADVESVRGVACGEILRQLMQLDLVRISGRSEDLGRPYLYGTTKRFLKICGLASINALPAIDSRAFCDDLSGSQQVAKHCDDSDISSTTRSADDADSQVPKESDVSLAVTDAPATDSVLSHFTTGVADRSDESLDDASSTTLDINPSLEESPCAVIEDEEDERFEGAFDGIDDDDDLDDDFDDEDDDRDDDDEEDIDEDDFDVVEEDSWEEVDDDEADEDWDDEDDDWDDDDDDEL